MARLTPALIRAASILNLFAVHSQQSFTLSDILRVVKMNRATLHSLLATLVEVGYLYRSNDKTYRLGPALIHLAQVTRDSTSPLQVALPEMRALSDRYDVVCSAVFKVQSEAVVRHRTASETHLHWTGVVDRRFPLEPPLGVALIAWSSEAEIQKWLAKIGPSGDVERERYERSLRFQIDHGFACGVLKRGTAGTHHMQDSPARLRDTDFTVHALDPDHEYIMTFLAAPVFDDLGLLAFSIVMTGFNLKLGREVEDIGRNLREACDRVTAAAGGFQPAS